MAEVRMFWRDGRGPPPERPPVPYREAFAATRDALRLAWETDPTAVVAVLALHALSLLADVALLRTGEEAFDAVARGHRATSQSGRIALLGLWNVGAVAAENAGSAFQTRAGQAATRAAERRVLDVVAAVELADVEAPDFQDRLQNALLGAHEQAALIRSALGAPMTAARLVVALTALGSDDWALVPLAAAGVIPQWLAGRRQQDPGRARRGRMREMRDVAVLRHFLTGPQAAHELRAFGAAPVLRARHDDLAVRADLAERAANASNLRRNAFGSLAAKAASAPVGARLLLRVARRDTTLAEAATGGVAGRRLSKAFQSAIGSAGWVRRHAASAVDYTRFVAAVAPPAAYGPAPGPDFECISVENVTFTYPGQATPVLHGVNLEIRRGEMVALVGENGSGKTTLAKLVCCLYRPGGGRILWDGVDIGGSDPAAVRSHIAVVFQDFVRYESLTAADNIGIGRPDRFGDRAAIVEAARRAGADSVIQGLPDGYDTVLSRQFGGVNLSMGQWQRVALARAFLRDTPLVVLDEPTAALDPRAERDLFETVATLYKGRSALLISHRLSSVRFADRICVLVGGRITESGTHDDLLAAGGAYAELFAMQAHAYR